MTKLKVKFTDFWTGFNPGADVLFGGMLREYSDSLVLSNDDPDIVIFSVFGTSYRGYPKALKVLHTPENFCVNQYPAFDYVTGLNQVFKHDCKFSMTCYDFDHRNIRMPNYIRRYGYESVKQVEDRAYTEKTKNILFLYRNQVEYRNSYVRELMKHIQVDSPGECLRNLPYQVIDKLEFMKQYKLVLAFENTIHIGYSSEKIYDCYLTKCIPVYYGDPNIDRDYDSRSMILANKYTPKELAEKMNQVIENKTYFDEIISVNPIINKDLFDKSNFDRFIQRILKEARNA